MKLFKFDQGFFDDDTRTPELVNDWYSLGIMLNVPTYKLSYVLNKDPDGQQRRIKIDGRTVYQSSPALDNIQKKLKPVLYNLQNQIPRDQMLAYQKGVNPVKALRDEADKKYLVKFDVKKYYDHITAGDITKVLQSHGFTRRGAKLVARLATVKRKVKCKDGKTITLRTLQQGSSASPVLSNLVGYWFIDRYALEWIDTKKREYPEISWNYYRYSDNIAMFVDSDRPNQIPLELLKEFREHMKSKMAEHKLYTHKWAMVQQNHPKIHMKFLGVIFNKVARVSLEKFEQWRSILFNACKSTVASTAVEYWDKRGRPDEMFHGLDPEVIIDVERFFMVAQGNVSYIKSVNAKQGTELEKLLKVARAKYRKEKPVLQRRVWTQGYRDTQRMEAQGNLRISDSAFEILKSYKDADELVEDFVERIGVPDAYARTDAEEEEAFA